MSRLAMRGHFAGLLLVLSACGEAAAPPVVDPSSRVVITPGQARLAAAGDTARLRAALYDASGERLEGHQLTWTSLDPDIFGVDQTGLVTGLQPMSVGRVVASVSTLADTAYVVVANPDASPCLGYAAPLTLAPGQSAAVSMTDGACIAPATDGEEYLVVPWQGSLVGSTVLALEVSGRGLAAPPTGQSIAPRAGAPLTGRAGGADGLTRSFDLDRQIRHASRAELMPRARQVRDVMKARLAGEGRAAAIPAYLAIGDLVDLNANIASSCVSPSLRTGRVVAVGLRAIVVHDTANPADGFTDADYARFATAFDTLVAPVADVAFGAPTDIDVNGKVVVFFTRAVNELTPAGANYYYGGFFHPRDLLPRTVYGSPYCPASNEREMFYMLVPDPTGVVNGNQRSVALVDSLTVSVLAHEHQHLVNFARRAYVNDALVDEEVWLNEGLSHVAEELVFYRASGRAPRQNIGGSDFGTQPFDGLFNMYMGANFARFALFLEDPQSTSPYSSSDGLGTRGAVWAFLRYAADRRGATDGDVWMRLVNSRTSGFLNLAEVFGSGILRMMHEWDLSLYTDDHVTGVTDAQLQPSWNFRTAYPALPVSPRAYPLDGAVRGLTNEQPLALSLRAGGAAFVRFAVPGGREASIGVISSGLVPPPVVQATIVRTR